MRYSVDSGRDSIETMFVLCRSGREAIVTVICSVAELWLES